MELEPSHIDMAYFGLEVLIELNSIAVLENEVWNVEGIGAHVLLQPDKLLSNGFRKSHLESLDVRFV